MRHRYFEPVSNAERQRQHRERKKNAVGTAQMFERQARLLVMKLRTHDEKRVVLRLPDSSTPAEDYLSAIEIVRFYDPTIIPPAETVTFPSRKKSTKRNVTAPTISPTRAPRAKRK
jgi:hypothetical protein